MQQEEEEEKEKENHILEFLLTTLKSIIKKITDIIEFIR